MTAPLDLFQDKGADWLAKGPNVLYLADQMRVGKTPQCVVACARVQAQRVLVLCPAIVRAGWLADFKAFCPDPGFAANTVLIYSAKDVEKIEEGTRLIVCSYDLAIKDEVSAALYSRSMVFGLDVLILDEAHTLTRIGDADEAPKRTKNVLGSKCTGEAALAGLASRVWFVSGTPMRRDASDLFPFCRMAGLWAKSKQDFTNAFCFGYHDGYEYKITGSKNLPKLKSMLSPVTLRRLRTDIADVKLNIGTVAIEPRELSPAHDVMRQLQANEPKYAKLLAEGILAEDFSGVTSPSISTTRRIIGLAKVHGIVELVKEELDADETAKIVIFGIYRDTLRALRTFLTPYKPGLLFGGTNAEGRDRMMHSFRENRKCRVMICNLASAGMGIDLSMANTLYIAEASWIPVDNAQALSRIVSVRKPEIKEAKFISLATSVDDAVTRICARRSAEIEEIYREV